MKSNIQFLKKLTLLKKNFFYLIFTYFCFSIFFVIDSLAEFEPRLTCKGIIAESKESISIESSKLIIKNVFQKHIPNEEIEISSVKNYKNGYYILADLKNQKKWSSPELLFPIKKELLKQNFFKIDFDCIFNERFNINKFGNHNNNENKDELNDDFCSKIGVSEITEKSKYFSCDPRWPLKITGLLKLTNKKNYSKDWFNENEKSFSHLKKSFIGIVGTDYYFHPEMGLQPIANEFKYEEKIESNVNDLSLNSTAIALIKSPKDRDLSGFLNEGPDFQFIEGIDSSILVNFFKSNHNEFSLIKTLNMIISQNISLNFLVIKEDFPLPSDILREIIQKLVSRGIVIITPVSDDIDLLKKEEITITYPAQYEDTITVAGVNTFGNPYQKSGFGTSVDFAAPSEDIFSLERIYKDNIFQYGLKRKSSNLFAGVISAGILSIFFEKRSEQIEEYKYKKNDLIRYLLLYLDKANSPNIFCDHDPKNCENIGLGLYGQGIINLQKLLETPIPNLKDFSDWVKGDEDFDPLKKQGPIVKNFFNDFSLFIQKGQINLNFWIDVFMGLFDLENEFQLELFIRENGAQIMALVTNDLSLQKIFIEYWHIEESIIDLTTQNNKKKPDDTIFEKFYQLKSDLRKRKIKIFGFLHPHVNLFQNIK